MWGRPDIDPIPWDASLLQVARRSYCVLLAMEEGSDSFGHRIHLLQSCAASNSLAEKPSWLCSTAGPPGSAADGPSGDWLNLRA
jgi:hypothetical protein